MGSYLEFTRRLGFGVIATLVRLLATGAMASQMLMLKEGFVSRLLPMAETHKTARKVNVFPRVSSRSGVLCL